MRAIGMLAGILLLAPVWASDGGTDDVVESLRVRMGTPEVLRGEFMQRRELHMLRRPLISRGEFLLAREHGLLWQQSAPFASSLLLQSDRMVQRVGDGEPSTLYASEQPVPFAISQIFLSLLSGDGSGLQEHFALSLDEDAESWVLTLTPRPGPLATAIVSVVVSGSRFVDGIEIATTAGDRTTIEMSGVTDTPAELSAEESDAFDG